MQSDEIFFMDAIRLGSMELGINLTDEEKELIKMPVSKCTTNEMTEQEREIAKQKFLALREKSIKALSAAYKFWLQEEKAKTPMIWREHINTIHSRGNDSTQMANYPVLGTFVDEWYLAEGRSLEKSSIGCGTAMFLLCLLPPTILKFLYI